MNKQTLISGITISGDLTIAHYLVVAKQLQTQYHKSHHLLLFVADLHAVTTPFDPKMVAKRRLKTLAAYYAMGFKPENVFVQSDILEHSLLYFLLARYALIGELKRMTQFKAKQNQYGQLAALFNYPLLMAADILLYDADVLVGPDQKQHIELSRNLAIRINNLYRKPLFHVPKLIGFHPEYRIRDLQNPTQKMSKSTLNQKGIIFLTDSPSVIRKKIQRAVTDSDNKIVFDFKHQPGVANLILLYALAREIDPKIATKELQALPNYFVLKELVADTIIALLNPLQAKIAALAKNPTQLNRFRKIGAKTAATLAKTKMRSLAPFWGFDWN